MPPFLDSVFHVDILTSLEGSAKSPFLLKDLSEGEHEALICMYHRGGLAFYLHSSSASHSTDTPERVHVLDTVDRLRDSFWNRRKAVSELTEFTISWARHMLLY